MRLKYRYLDLRREQMQYNFAMRHKVARAIREYLSDNGFLEIETPFMTRSTPKAPATISSPAACIPATSMRCRSPRRSSSRS